MITNLIEEAFTPEWAANNISDPAHELVIMRRIIPRQQITDGLMPFYSVSGGRRAVPLRTVSALLIIQKLRGLSDRETVIQVKENRYIQYFCNVPDAGLPTFIHPSTLSKIRGRIGEEGAAVIESAVFAVLRDSGVINGHCILTDSTVLPANIAYPTDIGLICDAFEKMRQFAENCGFPIWFDEDRVKKLRREYNMNRDKSKIPAYFSEFAGLFTQALRIFALYAGHFAGSEREEEKVRQLLNLLTLFNEQNALKLAGEKHIKDRIVSLSDPDMRPIKKGKSHPACEFGTKAQMTFNRDGFMITAENFIGNPPDTEIFAGTFALFTERMQGNPAVSVTDSGFRSRDNIKNHPPETKYVFMGRSSDICEEKRPFFLKARSATEGFIAAAKNLRGFGKCLYRGLRGHRIWSRLCQTAYNLKKFFRLYSEGKIKEESLIKLGLG
jgi:IS5 family transposase